MSEHKPSQSFARVAVILPIAAIVLAIAQAQWRRSQGLIWDLPLAAYDPRDILRGKYLNVRFSLDIDEVHCDAVDCCVCYRDADFSGDPSKMRARSCEEARERCTEWLELEALRSSYRYFIPEARSNEIEQELQKASNEKRARIRFVVDRNQRPQITEIRIDGEVLR